MVLFNKWRWQFLAFESAAEGCPAQAWFDGLPQDHKEEIIDLLDYVRNTTNRPWPDNVYDALKGEGGISEIKVQNIRCLRDGKVREITYRIYGFFGPKGYEHAYTFLHGTEKSVKNDRSGKQIAKGRLGELARGTGGVREFKFEKEPDSEIEERPRRPN